MAIRKTNPHQVPREAATSTAHLDLSQALRVSLPSLKLSTETISLRMPATLLDTIKIAVVPGEAFGAPGFFRFSYALGDDQLAEGLERFANFVNAG